MANPKPLQWATGRFATKEQLAATIYRQRQKKMVWTDIAASVGVSERTVRRIYAEENARRLMEEAQRPAVQIPMTFSEFITPPKPEPQATTSIDAWVIMAAILAAALASFILAGVL